jgi:hypothetical protein
MNKPTRNIIITFFLMLLLTGSGVAQIGKPNVMNQKISIVAENESLAEVIEQICDYLNLNYSYNSKLLEGKQVSMSVSNIPLKQVLEKLMKDHFLIFEIENNILVVRNYTPMKDHTLYDENGNFIAPNMGFRFTNKKKKAITLKFKTASNLIIIPVRVNSSDTLNFILDTGVRYPIVTELPYVKKLNLNYLRPMEVMGLGGKLPLTAYRSGGNIIELNGLTAKNQDVQMIINEDFQVSQILGIPVHGLIGFNIFRDFIVRIDYMNSKITFYDPDRYKYRKAKRDIVYPLHFEGTKPYIYTTIVQDDLSKVRVKLLVDTGASDALWLATESSDKLKLPEKNINSFLGKGLSGELHGKKGRIAGIDIGSTVLFEPIVSYPDTFFTAGISFDKDRNGTLGAEILRRFSVIIDYTNKKITFRKNYKTKERFNYNMSGMEVYNPMPGFPIFTVNQVREGSPAYNAGIRVKDQILSVNGSSHKDLTLNDINMTMMLRENKRIRIVVLRGGEKVKTEFRLKKEL